MNSLRNKLYNSFINKQSEKDFFIGFTDYFSYLDKNPELLACFIPELQKAKELNDTVINAENLAIVEFKETLEKVKKDTKKNDLDTRPYIMELYNIHTNCLRIRSGMAGLER